MRPIALVFEAADGRPLAATVLEPRRVEGAVVIASATGVPRRIYEGVAGCLADAGLAVLTFDYRGIGGSREGGPLRLEAARMQDWGRLDLEGALGWMRRAYAGAPLMVLGHSAGGQLIGLAPSARHLAGAALVGSQLGWAGHWPWPARAVMWTMWHGLIPALTSVMGYLPMQRLGQGEDLPAGVAREWAAWGRRRNYLFDALGPEVREAYAGLRFPVRALHIADDLYAPGAGCRPWRPSTEATARSTPSPPPRRVPRASATSAGSVRGSRRRSGRPSATGSSSGSSPRRFATWAELLDS